MRVDTQPVLVSIKRMQNLDLRPMCMRVPSQSDMMFCVREGMQGAVWRCRTCAESESCSIACSQISERVLTCGDIGTASSKLKTEFAPLQHCFEFDDELWWHGGRGNNQENGNFPERESSKNLKVWLLYRVLHS